MSYRQIGDTTPEWRNSWIAEKIKLATSELSEGIFFDIGAGNSPYKEFVTSTKFNYISQDFNSYQANVNDPGNHTENWHYSRHDYICDILEIPDSINADVILCTEVLEHVPDTVAAFKKLVACTKPGGILIVTCPFISLMHQAPYWFQSGLSPFWFEYWAKELKLEILEMAVQGDYIDMVKQDFGRLMQVSYIRRKIFSLMLRMKMFERSRGQVKEDLISSGGCGTLVYLRKTT